MGCQFRGTPDTPDVVGLNGLHIECKRTERGKVYDWLDQAQRESANGSVPVVMHRRNKREWVGFLARVDDELASIEPVARARLSSPGRSMVGSGVMRAPLICRPPDASHELPGVVYPGKQRDDDQGQKPPNLKFRPAFTTLTFVLMLTFVVVKPHTPPVQINAPGLAFPNL